jgi:hypothetical protein
VIPERPRPILSVVVGTPPAPSKPHRSFAQQIRELFGNVAEAVTGKPTPYVATQRRKRREEIQGAFRLARPLAVRVRRLLLRFLSHQPAPYDPEAERGYAEHVLRVQMEEWSHDDAQEQDGSFHYGHASGFDPQP